MSICRLRSTLLVLLLLLGSALPSVAGDVGVPVEPELTAQHRTLARSLAEQALEQAGHPLVGKFYFISSSRVYAKADPEARKALVTHYRYADRTAFTTLVHLDEARVEGIDQVADGNALDLGPDEIVRAEEMARSLSEVRDAEDAESLEVVAFQLGGWAYGEDDHSDRVAGFQFYRPAPDGRSFAEDIGTVIVDLERDTAWVAPYSSPDPADDPLHALVEELDAGGGPGLAAAPGTESDSVAGARAADALVPEGTAEGTGAPSSAVPTGASPGYPAPAGPAPTAPTDTAPISPADAGSPEEVNR